MLVRILALSFSTLYSFAVHAQFSEDCTGATLGGSDVMPISDISFNGGDADFTVTNGCELGPTAFSDVVVCVTPQNSCNVDFSCSNSGGSHTRATVHEQACSANFSDCLAAGPATLPATPSTVSAALTNGHEYCFVCQNTVGNGSFTVNVTEQAMEDCGALPVELKSFSIGK